MIQKLGTAAKAYTLFLVLTVVCGLVVATRTALWKMFGRRN